MPPRLGLARILRPALGLVLSSFLTACIAPSGCHREGSADGGAATSVDLSPVPAPEGLLGDMFMPTPDATWEKTRNLVGGPALFLPQTFGALVTTLLKLPLTFAGEIDGAVPTLGAIVQRGEGATFGALAVHLRDGGRAIDQLTRAPEARFDGKLDEASKITSITPKPPAAAMTPVIGVLGNYLIIAARPEDLLAIGPYLARSLPARAMPSEDLVLELPASAMAGPIQAGLRRSWGNARENAENAGLPVMPLASSMVSALDAVGDAEKGRVALTIDAAGLHARATLSPKPGGGPASRAIDEMRVGDSKPLLDLPSGIPLGVLFREAPASRAAAAPADGEALAKLLGDKDVTEADRAVITAAVSAEAEARGDWVAIGVGLRKGGLSAVAKLAVTDEAKMRAALTALVGLEKLPSVRARLKTSGYAITTGKPQVSGSGSGGEGEALGGVERLRVAHVEASSASGKSDKPLRDKRAPHGPGDKVDPRGASDGASTGAVDLLYLLREGALYASVGAEPEEALRELIRAPSGAGASLGSMPTFKAAVEALGDRATFMLVGDVLRIVAARAGKPMPAESAPVVLALGKMGTPSALLGWLDVPAVTIQELIRHRDAFF